MTFFYRLTAVTLFFFLLPLWGTVHADQVKPVAQNGILDLRDWDFSRQGRIPLSGQWEFYWQQHLPPGSLDKAVSDPVIVKIPETWNTYSFEGRKLPGQGFATYRLRILMPETHQDLGLKFLDMSTAFRVYVNGVLVYGAGIAGKDSAATTPAYKPGVAVFSPPFQEMEVLVHVSNFDHWQGGLWEPILLGQGKNLLEYREKRLYLEALIFGSILIMGIYHLCLHGFRPQDKSSLYFGLFCLMMAIRTISHGERFICTLLPGMSWDVLLRWIYVSFHICIPLFLLYARSIFPGEINGRMVRAVSALGCVFALVCLFTPTRFFTLTMPLMEIVLLAIIVYGIWMAVKVIQRNRQDAGIFLAGVLIFSFAAVNDVLYTRQIIFTVHLSSLGLMTFILFQAVLISRRFSRAFFLVNKQQYILEKEIVQRKKAEAAVLVAAEQEKFALIGQVAGKMAHDFNNILGAVMGHTEFSLLDCNQESIRDSLNVILDQTRQGKRLTQSLVAFAKDQELKETRFNINEKFELVLALLKKDLEGVDVVTDFDPDLPDLLADPGMMEQALVNMILNSAHAMSLVPAPRLVLSSFIEGDRIIAKIRDNGCGIPEAYQNNIFEPAFTLKGKWDLTGAYGKGIMGTGYGMSNVKKCMDKHGADISFTSKPGHGTYFVLSFPVAPAGQRTVPESREPAIRGISGKRILVVEDEANISFILKKILTSPPLSNDLVISKDAESAMAMFDENEFDLISLDYLLPGNFTGLDVYHHIRETNRRIPIVFVSGNIHFIESIQGMKDDDPHMDHLVKPFENMEYAAMVAKWLA